MRPPAPSPDSLKVSGMNLSLMHIEAPDLVALGTSLDSCQDTLKYLRKQPKTYLSFQKKNFAQMKIVGQFNKGFIVCRMDGNPKSIYVVDQHAADE